jgi:hypothetical protein
MECAFFMIINHLYFWMDTSLPRLSCGKVKRLPRLSRRAVAPWREDIVNFDYLPDNFKSSLDNYA